MCGLMTPVEVESNNIFYNMDIKDTFEIENINYITNVK